VLSFYATKLLGAGEGGAVLTDDPAAAAFVREWRDYTDKPAGAGRGNDKMTDLEAALALCQLARLGAMLEARRLRAQRYHDLLARAASRGNRFRLPSPAGPRVWYRYAVELLEGTAAEVVEGMARRGVSAAEPVADWRPPEAPPCPVADRAYRGLVSLPLYPTLTEGEQARAAQAFLAACGVAG
jgi:perosamine synthetase